MAKEQPLANRRYDKMGRIPAPADARAVLHQCGPAGLFLPIRRVADETSTSKLYRREPSALLIQSSESGWGDGGKEVGNDCI